MRINYVGNTCNYAYWWAKLSREVGFGEAMAFIENTGIPRDLPWWDDPGIDQEKLPKWIFMMPKVPLWGGVLAGKSRDLVNASLSRSDIVHAFGGVPAIWAKRTGKPYVYHSYGDINSTPLLQNFWSAGNHLRRHLVIKAMRGAQKVILSQLCDLYNADRLGLMGKVTLLPIIYDCEAVASARVAANPALEKEYGDWEMVFYSPSRHIPEKGQDKLIRSFAKLLKQARKDALLVFTDWGSSVDQSKKLIEELGIASRVRWIPCQTKEGMMSYMKLPRTAVLDEFVDPSRLWSFGGISRDAMSMEAVLISRVSMEKMTLLHGTLPPMLWTDGSETSIYDRLLEFAQMSPDDRASMGKAEREWVYNEHHYANLLPRYFDIYQKMVG
jgi:glycosyltransferase involved in cell wall biosynthesis